MDQKALEAAARAIENGSAEEWEAMPLIHKQVFRSQAKAAITAYLAAMEAEGFVMVPVEPTPEMHDAGCDQILDPIGLYDAYRAMIAARPNATT